jgi:hypothetical protein
MAVNPEFIITTFDRRASYRLPEMGNPWPPHRRHLILSQFYDITSRELESLSLKEMASISIWQMKIASISKVARSAGSTTKIQTGRRYAVMM